MIKNLDTSVGFCDVIVDVQSPSDCNKLIKASTYDDCCYFEGMWGGVNRKSCIDLSPIRKDELDDYINELNKRPGVKIDKIVCNGHIISISSFILLLLFLL